MPLKCFYYAFSELFLYLEKHTFLRKKSNVPFQCLICTSRSILILEKIKCAISVLKLYLQKHNYLRLFQMYLFSAPAIFIKQISNLCLFSTAFHDELSFFSCITIEWYCYASFDRFAACTYQKSSFLVCILYGVQY